MSRKAELINIFKEYKGQCETVQKKITGIRQNDAFTEQGKEQAVNEILKGFEPMAKAYHDKAVSIIDTGVEALESKWKQASAGRSFDSGYQAGLSNVIKMLETGAITEHNDIKNIIDTYAGDYNALAVIKKLLLQSENESAADCIMMIPNDTREYNRRLLSQLKGNVDDFIKTRAVTETSGMSSASMSLDSMAEFVATRLKDDLELNPNS